MRNDFFLSPRLIHEDYARIVDGMNKVIKGRPIKGLGNND